MFDGGDALVSEVLQSNRKRQEGAVRACACVRMRVCVCVRVCVVDLLSQVVDELAIDEDVAVVRGDFVALGVHTRPLRRLYPCHLSHTHTHTRTYTHTTHIHTE